MNRILKISLLLAVSLVAISSCKQEDPEPYYYSYGIYHVSANYSSSFIVELDNNFTLIPTSVESVQATVKDSSRVMIMYYIDSKTDSTVNAKNVIVERVLSKDIIQLTYENEDSIGNDPVVIKSEEIWVSKYHLNIMFGIYGGAAYHSINLAKPIGNQLDVDNRQILLLKHNSNHDPYTDYFKTLVSFDMRSLNEAKDSINFILKADIDNNGTFSWIGTYYFKKPKSSKSMPQGIMKKSLWVQ